MASSSWLAIVVLAAGCAGEGAPPPPPGERLASTKPRITAPDFSDAERAQFRHDRVSFAFDLYREATASNPGNIVFSPHSISLALGMTFGGARGDTASEMAEALVFSQGDRVHAGFNDVDLQLKAADSDDFRLSITDQLFGQTGEPFLPSFLDLVAENYGADMRLVDFAGQPDPVREAINDWVAGSTDGRIADLLPPGAIQSWTRLVLVNLIYLDAKWLKRFHGDTDDRTFHTLAGEDVSVPTMSGNFQTGYTAGTGYQIVTLGYRPDQRTEMIFVVPDPGRFPEIEAALDADMFAAMIGQLELKAVDLFVPKFGFEAELPLKQLLQRRGMQKAFVPAAADFSGLDVRPVFVSDAFHKAFIRINEEGTQAAAGSAVVSNATSLPAHQVTLAIDRPFLFAIHDYPTGTILFLGRVTDPR